jgi:hypothetical protein
LVQGGPNLAGGLCRTSWAARSPDQVRDSIRVSWQPGAPTATRAAILQVVDAEQPPLRILFGRSLDAVTDEYHQRLATWNEWQPVSLAAYGEPSALSAHE